MPTLDSNKLNELIGDSLLTRQELSSVLKMSADAIGVAMCRNSFPIQPIRLGRRLRWRLSDVKSFIAGEAKS